MDEGLDGDAERMSVSARSRRAFTLAGLLTPPLAWLILAYLAALFAIFATAFFTTDPFTNQVVRSFTTVNFTTLAEGTYVHIVLRTIGIAVAVTVLCIAIALPFGYTMSRLVPARWHGLLVAAVMVPMWASYLVKAYAWRAMFGTGGVLEATVGPTPGFGLLAVIVTLTYLWLPYMILPVYTGFQRIPASQLEASADLGAGALTTFRRVVVPALVPAVAAGSVFTFSLSLGDYIVVSIVGGKLQVLGTAVLQNITLDLPFAAALGVLSALIMIVYLAALSRTGALENL